MKLYNLTLEVLDYESLGIYIGRFQPPHRGHLEIIKYMSKNHRDNLLIIVDGKNSSKDSNKNPYSLEKRLQMFNKILPENVKILVAPDSFIPKILQDNNYLTDELSRIVVYCGNDRKNDYVRYEKYLKELKHDIRVDFRILSIDRDNVSGTQLRQYIIDNNYEKIREIGIHSIIDDY